MTLQTINSLINRTPNIDWILLNPPLFKKLSKSNSYDTCTHLEIIGGEGIQGWYRLMRYRAIVLLILVNLLNLGKFPAITMFLIPLLNFLKQTIFILCKKKIALL